MNDQIRIGDAEREVAVSALSDHFVAGRLTREEFEERSTRAHSATTQRDVKALFVDLPGRPAAPPRARPGVGEGPRPMAGHGWRRPFWPAVLLPLLLVAIGLTVLTHLPFILLLLIGFICLRFWVRPRRHSRW